MDGLKKDMKGMESKIDCFKNGMEAKIDGIEEKMKSDMEGFKEGLTNLLQEMIPSDKKVVEETHDDKKISINHDFINYNVGLKTHHIRNIDMRKFYGKDPVTWIL